MTTALRNPNHASTGERRALLAKLHIAKKQLQLDDDTYREALERLTGKRSAGDCDEEVLAVVLQHFSNAGFKAVAKKSRNAVSGPAARLVAKIEALWLSGWNLGVIRDPAFSAMESFITRQTGIAKAQWLKEPREANLVIEALKSWLAREGGVKWPSQSQSRKGTDDPAGAVLEAQWKRLRDLGATPATWVFGTAREDQRALGKLIRKAQESKPC